MRPMTRRIGIGLGGALAAGLALFAAIRHGSAAPDDFDAQARGRYLTLVGDCVACHKRPGFSGTFPTGADGWVGGGRIETPFGEISVPNLTPDRDTGLGSWSADDFWRAMHEGVRPDGRRLYPAFPYPYYTNVTRDDSDAIYAYLRSVPPERNAVDRNTLPFPFDIRALMVGWNFLFFEPGGFREDANRSPEWNRGAYLVTGLAHCGACHTPKNVAGADRTEGRYMAGEPLQAWYVPRLDDDRRTGLGDWSVEEIVEYLRTGRNARSAASGPMAEVVQYSTALMTEADLRAMAVYLKALPRQASPAATPTPVAASDPQMRSGEAIYLDRCQACHTRTGAGVERMFPRLAGSQVVQQDGPDTLLRVVLQGTRAAYSPHAPTAPAMPAFGWRMGDAEVAAVTTYIRNAWGNAAPAVSEGDARRMRERLRDRPG